MTPLEQIKAIQTTLGVTADGAFGPRSRAALDALIKAAARPAAPPATPSGDYSAAFTNFFPFLMDWEGETYENDPDDPGGATKFGIDKRSHPDVDIRNLTKEGAMAIYWKEWVAARCERMASPYAEVYFNCVVNMGTGRAKEFDTSAKGDPVMFLDLQVLKYRSIAAINPNMSKFLAGWLNRTRALRNRFGL